MAKQRNFLKSFKNALKSSSDLMADPYKPVRDYVGDNVKNKTVQKVVNTVDKWKQKGKNVKNRALGLGVTIMESYADADRKKYPNTKEGKARFRIDAKQHLRNQKNKKKKKK